MKCYISAIILELEAVQRRFTIIIEGIGLLPYSDRLNALELTTLAERSIRGDLIETFRIVRNLVEYGPDVFGVSRSGNNIVSNIRVVATTPRKDPQPNISDLRDHSQSIFRPILTRVPKRKKKKKKKKEKKVATPIY